MRLYKEWKNVEKALLCHAQNALENKYIEPMINEDTGLIEDDLPTVLTYLDTNYGKVLSEEVKQKESEVLSTSFNPADPIVVLFCLIEQLQKLAIAAGIPYSTEQQLEIGLTIIRSTRDFEKSLGEWNNKVPTIKTWTLVKTHFTRAQTDLKAIRGPTMQQAGFHHVNMLADQLQTDLQLQGTQMLVVKLRQQSTNWRCSSTRTCSEYIGLRVRPIRNAPSLARNFKGPSRRINDRNSSGGRGERDGGRSHIRKTPDNASFVCKMIDLYFWTQGSCNHLSKDCLLKANGYKDNATKTNHMWGSNAFYEWQREMEDDIIITDKLANAFNNKFILSTSVVSPEPILHITQYCVPTSSLIAKEGTITIKPSIL